MSRRKPNRGVVLLVVLSLLVLFVVMGLTFIVLASQYRRSSVASAKRKKLEEQPEKLADLALYQLLRGTRGSRTPSAMHGWDLLGDLYGNDGVKGVVVGNGLLPQAAPAAGGDFITLRFNFSADQPFGRFPQLDRAMLLDDYFNGRVLTMTSGAFTGRSTRVVDYYLTEGLATGMGGPRWGLDGVDDDGNGVTDDYNERGYPFNPLIAGGDQFFVRVETFSTDATATGLPSIGDEFIINGRPFNGTGNGYLDVGFGNRKGMTAPTYNLDAVAYDRGADGAWGQAGADDDGNGVTDDASEAGFVGSDDVPLPMALTPHFGAYPGATVSPDLGGQDEPYDAPDYQNMFLAMVSPDPSMEIIPSFHRPSLINFWANNPDPTIQRNWYPATNRWWKEFRRRVVFRPMPWDHPNFSGGNLNLALSPSPIDWDMSNATDQQPGIAGVDDDNNGVVDDWSEIGWPGSDDRLTATAEARIFAAMTTQGAYDIDNDGDGRKDSNWIDIGLPVKTAPDGRLYKPLVSVMCVDMGGRLNVNAHGQLAHLPHNFQNKPNSLYPALFPGTQRLQYGIWHPGPDGRPGRAGVDDDNNGTADDLTELGYPESDDLYQLNPASLPLAAGGGGVSQYLFPDPTNAPYNVNRTVRLPRGFGLGPAEISLLPAFWGAFRQTQPIMAGRYSNGVPGIVDLQQDKSSLLELPGPMHHKEPLATFGAPPITGSLSKRPGRATRDYFLPGPDGNWGVAGVDDNNNGTVDDWTEMGYPRTDDIHINTAFGDPPNVAGLGPVGLDLVGNSYFLDHGTVLEHVDNPYEHSPQDLRSSDTDWGRLGGNNATAGRINRRYSVKDLEGMLRSNDIDASRLNSRLLANAGTTLRGGSPRANYRRNMLTTHQSHIPNPPVGVISSRRGLPSPTTGGAPPQVLWPSPAGRNGNRRSPHILDLYVERLLRNGITPAQLQGQLDKIVPWELRHGLKFDVNRPFGNGIDDDKNDVVDDPQEWLNATYYNRYLPAASIAPGEVAFPSHRSAPTFTAVPFDYRNGGPNVVDARHMYARHLYCLMMLLTEEGYVQPFIEQSEEISIRTESVNTYGDDRLVREITAQRIAQWAINVVDFRDSDAIMTPFEYDMNPFDGWDVDGWVSVGPGPDGAWGQRGVDDNMNGAVDERAEAGAGDDIDDRLRRPGAPAPNTWPKNVSQQRRVVWGVERPDLMLTEAKAFHNVRTKDSEHDDDTQKEIGHATMPDDDMDAYRIPQGSLFIELYCPQNRAAHDPRLPAELYDFNGNLTLNRIAVGRNPGMPGNLADRNHPVWRVVIARKTENAPMGEPETPLEQLNQNRFTSTEFEPNNMRLLYDPNRLRTLEGRDQDQMEIDRVIWFARERYTGMTPGAAGLDGRLYGDNIFQATGGWEMRLTPGQFAVIAPRPITRVSSGTNVPTGPADLPPQVLTVGVDPMTPATYGKFSAVDYNGNPATPRQFSQSGGAGSPPQVKDVLGIIASTAPDPNWVDSGGNHPDYVTQWGIGLNISEPLPQRNGGADYYDVPEYDHPLGMFNPTDPQYSDDYYYDEAAAMMGTAGDTMPDQPFDGDNPAANWRERPLKNADGDDMLAVDTYEDVRTCFLQRLTNPLVPWNPMPGNPLHSPAYPVNPYISVDWASTDLTVYNGEDRTGVDPDGTSDPMPGALKFSTRQRGKFGVGDQPFNFFNPIAEQAPDVNQQPAGVAAFRYELRHTLGYLNNSDAPGTPANMLRFRREATATSATTSSLQYAGDPFYPLPTIWWQNRPFANAMELLQVPSSTPGRFFLEFRPNREQTPPNEWDNYNEHPSLAKKRRFYHLLNFFSSHSYDPITNNIRTFAGPPPRAVPGAKFYRLFDFVETPSPFVNTDKWLNSTAFSLQPLPGPDGRWGRAGVDDNRDGELDDVGEAGWPGSDDINTEQDEFRPPFNKIARQRDPGRINLNTIPITPLQGPDGRWGLAGVDDDNNMTVDDASEFGLGRIAGVTSEGISDDFRAGPLEGLMKGYPALDTARFSSKFFMSRRGFHTVSRDASGSPDLTFGAYGLRGRSNPLQLDAHYPTRFANPFRPAWSTSLMPRAVRDQMARDRLLISKNQINGSVLLDTSGSPFMDEIQGTLLRRDSLTPTRGADGQWGAAGVDDNLDGVIDNEADGGAGDDVYRAEPLFVPDPASVPLATARWRDQNRHSNQRYLPLQRMANLTSTTSNVYAVWITVGFFEVEPVSRIRTGGGFEIPESHPDGYRLGRELGSNTGEIRRHRAFYVIDRSAPVAYEPGENHNVDRAILLRRFIQ